MKLTKRQKKLFELVKKLHGEQKRKYTNEPYYNHLYQVAELVEHLSNDNNLLIEKALCHDVLEDTECNFRRLVKNLYECGYNYQDAYLISFSVRELTDVFTSKAFPYLNRKIRKESECLRLATITNDSQTIKYADIINNTSTIEEHDKSFAKVYFEEKKAILKVMYLGDFKLYQKALGCVKSDSIINNPDNKLFVATL